jgi:hypothetical protein
MRRGNWSSLGKTAIMLKSAHFYAIPRLKAHPWAFCCVGIPPGAILYATKEQTTMTKLLLCNWIKPTNRLKSVQENYIYTSTIFLNIHTKNSKFAKHVKSRFDQLGTFLSINCPHVLYRGWGGQSWTAFCAPAAATFGGLWGGYISKIR